MTALLEKLEKNAVTMTDEEYLRLTDHTTHLMECVDGELERLPMPTDRHQSIAGLFFLALTSFLVPLGGTVRFAPIRVRIRPGWFREPDVIAVLDAKDPRRRNRFWTGADLAADVVGPDDPQRVYAEKRSDYAKAGISEYWIIDPRSETIQVLRLVDGAYIEQGTWRRGERATSPFLGGFGVEVDSLFESDAPPDGE